MKAVIALGLVASLVALWGCSPDCECICKCTEGGTDYDTTVTVAEEGDCKGECDSFTADTCPTATSEGFSVDCS